MPSHGRLLRCHSALTCWPHQPLPQTANETTTAEFLESDTALPALGPSPLPPSLPVPSPTPPGAQGVGREFDRGVRCRGKQCSESLQRSSTNTGRFGISGSAEESASATTVNIIGAERSPNGSIAYTKCSPPPLHTEKGAVYWVNGDKAVCGLYVGLGQQCSGAQSMRSSRHSIYRRVREQTQTGIDAVVNASSIGK